MGKLNILFYLTKLVLDPLPSERESLYHRIAMYPMYPFWSLYRISVSVEMLRFNRRL